MRSMRADGTMSGLADDDGQSRRHPADNNALPHHTNTNETEQARGRGLHGHLPQLQLHHRSRFYV